MLIIYCTKPHFTRICMKHIKDLILAEAQENEEIKFIHQIMFKNIHLNYSRKKSLSWSELPCSFEPEYTISEDMADWLPMELKNGEIQSTEMTFQDVQSARKIIFFVDPGSSDLHDIEIFLDHLKTKPECQFILPYSLDKQSLEKELSKRKNSLTEDQEFIKKSKIKRFFTYNYNLNSLFIFGQALKKNNIDNNHVLISKYGLQTLYFIQNNPMDKNKLYSSMCKWSGTGKYTIPRIYLGGMTSVSYIIDELLDYKFIEEIDKKIHLTETGEKFLSFLHKDCKDLDLPFRINLWENLDEPTAKQKISTYLKSYFGKQKRKQNN